MDFFAFKIYYTLWLLKRMHVNNQVGIFEMLENILKPLSRACLAHDSRITALLYITRMKSN